MARWIWVPSSHDDEISPGSPVSMAAAPTEVTYTFGYSFVAVLQFTIYLYCAELFPTAVRTLGVGVSFFGRFWYFSCHECQPLRISFESRIQLEILLGSPQPSKDSPFPLWTHVADMAAPGEFHQRGSFSCGAVVMK